MISEKQLAANRRNAEQSTGPRTDAGKNRSSLNARRHNLTGQVTAMTDPDRAAFNQFIAGIMKDLAPEGALEIQLAQRIAHDHWRLNRCAAVEDNIYALGHFKGNDAARATTPRSKIPSAPPAPSPRKSKNLQLLSLYEQRSNRTLHRNPC